MCEEVAREVCGDGFCRVIAGVGSGFFFIIYINLSYVPSLGTFA